MNSRLYELFYVNGKARRAMYGTAGSVSILVGVASLASGTSAEEAASVAMVLALVISIAWTFVYSVQHGSVAKPALEDSVAVPRRFAFAGVLASLAILFGVSTKKIEAAVIDNRLKRITSGQTTASTLQQVRAILNVASAEQVTIDGPVVKQLHEKLREASGEHQRSEIADSAWESLLQLARHQSLLATGIAPRLPAGELRPLATFYSNWKTAFDWNPKAQSNAVRETALFGAGSVEASKAARLHCIEYNPNAGRDIGPESILMVGLNVPGTPLIGVSLDDIEARKVRFDRVRLIYKGGALHLSSVYAIQCEFEIERTPNGRRLVDALVLGQPIDFLGS